MSANNDPTNQPNPQPGVPQPAAPRYAGPPRPAPAQPGASQRGPLAPSAAPRNRERFQAATWMTAIFAPLVALALTFLVNLGSIAISRAVNPESFRGAEGFSNALYGALTTVLGLGGSVAIDVSQQGVTGAKISIYAAALTTTAIVGLALFFGHAWSGRGRRNSTFMVWIPAIISGFILSGATALLATVTRTTVEMDPNISMSIAPNPLICAATALPVGFLASAFGRLLSVRPTPRNRYLLTSASPVPTFSHAVSLGFAWYIFASTATAVVVGAGFLISSGGDEPFNLSSASERIAGLLMLLPYFLTVGALVLAGALGASIILKLTTGSAVNVIDLDEALNGLNLNQTTLIGRALPIWMWITVAVLAALFIIAIGVRWGRSRDPRLQYGPLSWFIMPLSFTGVTAVIYGITRFGLKLTSPMFEGKTIAAFTATAHWYMIGIGLLVGIAIELISRLARPRAPQTGATGYSAYR
ncbi:hypothetical protein HMPREF9233_00431 [Actinobaculum massiliense ACS-171-V-Col2]|uniref:Uncharacterized protein n=1 Tax=Actinobaculum massiliense ACS-171-V-Col2 TaxID=883066 RepID=K9EEH9_9ACTO|nr:hypothetical protein [Actinobaculum massiliense]EKU95644.1 hypothetical protein HMPREF9233_00431 [Actinobaculum massiliense ACS-171-V-Col2]MDK8318979.1 hypothetical protein [Actinobaculum massiliense]MDK8567614.1 hypothetical protein [Actinobaculum massiliense]